MFLTNINFWLSFEQLFEKLRETFWVEQLVESPKSDNENKTFNARGLITNAVCPKPNSWLTI